jgi:hypothetical protein
MPRRDTQSTDFCLAQIEATRRTGTVINMVMFWLNLSQFS